MNSNSFKNADIDRKNEQMNTEYSCGNCGHQFKDEEDWAGNCDEHSCCYCECDCSDCASSCDDEPTMECARCGHRGLTEGEVCIREWEGDSDAPMCAPCWDETEEEENALEEGGEEGLEILLNERKNLFGCSSTADMVSAELVEEEEAKEVYGVCDCCGMEGKFFGEEGDDWTCPTCAYGNCSCDEEEDPAEEEGRCEDCGEKDTDECRPDCPYQIKAQIKHLLADLDRVEGKGGVQRFITEELRYLF